jgi:putative transcriptional regulator
MDTNFFNKYHIDLGIPEKGKLLISEPFLFDPNFNRTVILITEHNEDGTVGFVLNKNTTLLVQDVVENFPEIDAPLFVGGPVEPNRLNYIHTYSKLSESIEISDNLYWGGNFDELKLLIETNKISANDIRFFSGYSGWDKNQLIEEINEKSWIVAKAPIQKILHLEADKLWKKVMTGLGKKYEIMSNFPEDPSLN